jgi:hypothetical protein
MGIAQAGASILGGMMGSEERRAEQRNAGTAMQASRDAYMQQEYTNPYANLENPYEDLTVNQKQAQFQAQQGAQQRANILEGLRGAAGGAGIAGLAQAMAGQAALGTQRISASIGKQEAMNQRLRAQGAAKIQQLEAYGEQAVSLREQQRMETLYGMDMSRVTAANKAIQQSRQQMIAGIGQGLGTIAGGMQKRTKIDGGVGSLDVGLQRGSVQGLNYVPPQTNTFPLGQSSEFGFGQQQGYPFNQAATMNVGKTWNPLTQQWE